MPEEYDKLKKDLFSAKLFRKLRSIKEGEFPSPDDVDKFHKTSAKKLFKHEITEKPEIRTAEPTKIPREQIAAFEKTKKEAEEYKFQLQVDERTVKKPTDKPAKITSIDEILAKRPITKLAEEPEKRRKSKKKRQKASATEKIREGSMKAWVDRCYDIVHGLQSGRRGPDIGTGAEPDIRELLNWDRLPLGLDNVLVRNEARESESDGSLDIEPSSVEDKRSSSDATEKILRVKAGAPLPQKEEGPKKEFESQSEVEIQTKSGVNFVLSDYFVRDLQELKSLAFNEELYAFHPELGIVGSWSVDAKVCETDHKCVNVQFEGLLVDEDTSYAMYSAGIVDRKFNPITEFRVEQVTKPNLTRSRTMFFHKKRSKWLFDLREGIDNTETRKTLTLNYLQMMRVVSEAAHILLMRKIVIYHRPFRFEEITHELKKNEKYSFCPCASLSQTCTCKLVETPFAQKTRSRLKMRSLCIGGDICRTNYRPVSVPYNGVQLEVVRIRRRVMMPGNLIQTSNYYMTTAGQLLGVTFNDPYPFDTPFWLQVDPKAVLNRHRVVSPERIVPLRERYMCDPELKQFYEDEVDRLILINKTFLNDHPPIRNSLKSLFQDLLNDKPHRVLAFIQDFFFEGYRFKESLRDQRIPLDDLLYQDAVAAEDTSDPLHDGAVQSETSEKTLLSEQQNES